MAGIHMACLLTLFLASGGASAQTIEIKGLRYGVGVEELRLTYPGIDELYRSGDDANKATQFLRGTFTVGGVQFGEVALEFRDGTDGSSTPRWTLEGFKFDFVAAGFDDIRAALRMKYPTYPKELCTRSQIQTPAGVAYTQVQCTYTDAKSILVITKYGSDIETGLARLLTPRKFLELERNRAKKNLDI